ncbi:hypothetical protein [Bradyrhizobium sp. sBnM-33]|uniref:hypothetical protein n=1 Tax=Bradyrhizobium sp. sBnM-33 TaxID=2831780 RepID=UPI001BCCD379|nr:hypothetical protein [Bradyrhizobium sp. sBnM-33]WOH52672.1 hypothetical protein RX328_11375 [Bradyrhizobium sp. sBnM-33]
MMSWVNLRLEDEAEWVNLGPASSEGGAASENVALFRLLQRAGGPEPEIAAKEAVRVH